MLSKILKNKIFRILVFVAAGISFAATSKITPDGVISYGFYVLSSDCVSPVITDLNIEVDNEAVVSPAGDSFTDYGFPTGSISVIDDNVGPVGSVERRCGTTYGNDDYDDTVWIFTCYDNNEYSCSIVIRQ